MADGFNFSNLASGFNLTSSAGELSNTITSGLYNELDFRQVTAGANTIRPENPRAVTIPTGASEESLAQSRSLQQELLAAQQRRDYYRANALSGPYNSYGVRTANAMDQQTLQYYETLIYGLSRRISALENGTSITINGLDIVVDASSQGVTDNPLNPYVDVQYHIGLTMIGQDEALEFQTQGFNTTGKGIDVNTMKAQSRSVNSVTLASTGGAFTGGSATADIFASIGTERDGEVNTGRTTTTTPDNNYYNIASLVVKNLMEPSENNPLVSTMLSMKMRIAEPHGFKLHEDIRDTARQLGYRDINPGRILYRVDIYFSGYEQDSGEWVEQIDLGGGVQTISSVMGISSMEAEVTSSGTMYDVDLVPAGHHAYRPEDFVLDAGNVNTGATFRDFLTYFSTALKTAKESRTQGQLLRNYEFFAPQTLLDSPFDIDEFHNQNKFLFASGEPDHIAASGRDVDIMTILRGSIANTLVAQEFFIADNNNDDFTTPRIHFGIRFNTIYGSSDGAVTVDPTLNDYREVTHQYIIEPFITFKHGPVTRETMDTYVDPESQLSRIREIIRLGMLRRIYNYVYTDENTEVIDFDIKLKAFYYETLNTSTMSTAAGRSDYGGNADQAIDANAVQNDLFRVLSTETDSDAARAEDTIRRLFGNYRSSTGVSSDNGARRGAERLGGGFNESPSTNLYGDVTSPPARRRGDYETHMSDYLSLDFLSLNGMKVRGDPLWLLSPYANHDIDGLQRVGASEGVATSTPANNINVRPRAGQIIFLRMFAPDQEDHMNPNRQMGSKYPNIIGGFYQVLDVTSAFEGGKFTQSIEGAKLNHLNYAEELFERSAGT